MPFELKRPMVTAAMFAAASAALCCAGIGLPVIWAVILGFGIICCVFFRRAVLPAALSAAVALSVSYGFKRMENKVAEAAKLDGTEALIEGEVWKNPDLYGGSDSIILKTENGFVSLSVFGELDSDIEIGDRLKFTGEYSVADLAKNDYAFDRRHYLYGKRIFLTASPLGKISVEKCRRVNPRILAGRLQRAAVNAGEFRLSGDSFALYAAAVFGDRQFMSGELKNQLSAAGLSHIAAVSGMHLSVVVSVLSMLLYFLLGRGRLSAAAAIVSVIAFATVTGGSDSVIRAAIMSVIFLGAKLIYRDADSLSSLGAAVSAMLLANPMVIYSVGFRLSVEATLGILLFVPLFKDKMSSLPRILKIPAEAALVGVGAQLAVVPELALSFHSLPLYFLISDVLVVPALSIALPLGLLFPAAANIPFIGDGWAWVCDKIFGYIVFMAEKISALPKARLKIGGVTALDVIVYFLCAAALYSLISKRVKIAAVTAVLAAAALVFTLTLHSGENKRTYLSFLNVGRGDAAIFRLSGGGTVGIDCGSGGAMEEYLTGCGRYKLDALVITGAASGKSGDLEALVSSGLVERLYLPAGGTGFNEISVAARENGTMCRYYYSPSQLYIDGLKLRMETYSAGSGILAEYSGARIYFSPNAYTAWPECDIIKLPGSGTGKYNFANEAKGLSAEYGVLSSYASAEEKSRAAQAVKSNGIPVFVTGRDGTVTFEITGGVVQKPRLSREKAFFVKN